MIHLFSDNQVAKMMKNQKAGIDDYPKFKNLDKVKKQFINDFGKGKLKEFEVMLSNMHTLKYDPMSLNLFGVTPQFVWSDLYAIISGDKSMIKGFMEFLDTEALKYTFTNDNLGSLKNKIFDKAYSDILHSGAKLSDIDVVSVQYGDLLLYVNPKASGK